MNLWIETAFNVKIVTTSTAICKIFPFFIYTMLDFSVMIIVILTADKLYAVLSPFKAFKRKFKKKKLVIISFFALLVCCLINSHYLYTLNILPVNLNSNSIDLINNSHNSEFVYINGNIVSSCIV